MVKAVIFDMDGVVIDSNHIHYENWNQIFQRRFNITLRKDDFAKRLGESARHFTEFFLQKYDLDVKYEELYPEIRSNLLSLADKIAPKPGIADTLAALKEKGYKIALATGANKEAADGVLNHFGIGQYFDFVIGGDEVKRAKPDPEIFLRAAMEVGIEPSQCVVIEDAYLGLLAAKAAGMRCIIVKDDFSKDNDFSKADMVLDSNKELISRVPELA